MRGAAERVLSQEKILNCRGAVAGGINLDALKIQLPPAERAFRRGLYEAAALLLSLTI